jgi:hypothetical protein
MSPKPIISLPPGSLDPSSPSPPSPNLRPAGRRWRKPAVVVLIAAYFLFMSWDGLKAHFAPDEMMAIYTYWHPSPWRLLVSQFMLWRGYFRPVGGLFYLPLYWVSGLNPAPYHAVLLLLLLAGAYQMYRFARVLGCAELPAAMAALIACYHGGLSNLYYNSVFVFDVLCGVFYLAAFVYYARIRAAGLLPKGRQTAAFLGLYLCALNSKEMAVTMPVILLAYEWLYHGAPRWRWRELLGWLRGPGRVLCWASLLNLIYIYGKAFGPYGLMKQTAYTPVFSWERMADFQERYLGDIFYHLPALGWLATVIVWLAVTYLAWRRRRPLTRFLWIYVLVTPLPIEFLIGRDQACLYVTLAGWAVLAATLFTDWLPGATRVVAAEPLFHGLDPARVSALLAVAAMVAWALGNRVYQASDVAPVIPQLGLQTYEVLAQFQALNPRIPQGAKVVFLDDPWPNGFDMAFIAELWFRDRKDRIFLNRKTPLPAEEIAKADAVFDWHEGRLIRVR